METILIVDDEPLVLNTIRSLVRVSHPKTVILHASHGAHAWEIINAPSRKPHILISDIEMPEMDGIQLAEKVHREHPDVRIILMSGNEEPENHRAHGFLRKPVSRTDLLTAIKRIKETMESH